MRNRRIRHTKADAELDITSFMNLMIVLVPVLLLNMVFSTITVLDLKLPKPNPGSNTPNPENRQLELVIREDIMRLYFPAGILLREFPKKMKVDKSATAGATEPNGADAGTDTELASLQHDFDNLSGFLRQVKASLQSKGIEKRDIVILADPNVDYQTIVAVMDTVRSYKAVQISSVVNAELFPDISMGDAPRLVDVGAL